LKRLLSAIPIFLVLPSFGQNINLIEKNLSEAFSKIEYWYTVMHNDYDSTTEDSLGKANENFGKLLLKYTSKNPQTLVYGFKKLVDSGLRVVSSEDGKFRIYTWDMQTGGTMHFFENVFQYRSGQKVHSKMFFKDRVDEGGDAGLNYYQINDIHAGDQVSYLVQAVAVLASNLYYFDIGVYNIVNDSLNNNVKLFKTKNGLKSEMGFEIDLAIPSNRKSEVPDFSIIYDGKNKTLSIPVILEDSKITKKRIVYHFNGKYFERN
jgi:hypothetical protein